MALPYPRCIFVLPLSLLAACSALRVPGEATSASAAPLSWSAVSSAAVPAQPLPPQTLAAWWRQFDDPLLDGLIEQALAASPDLRSAQARLRQLRAQSGLAQANLLPSLSGAASASRARSGTEAGGSGRTQTRYAAGVDASWEVSIFGGLRDTARAAEFDRTAGEASLDGVRASLVAEVALNYIALRSAQQRLAIGRENVASQGETLQMTEWRAQAGLASALDVAQARTNLEQSRSSLPSLEISRVTAENHLAVLCGRPAGSLAGSLGEIKALPTAPAQIAVGIPADTLRQRPDVRAAEQAVLAERARSAANTAERWPSLSLSGSFGWQGFSAASFGGADAVVRSLAGSLALSLFDGGRLGARIEAQEAVQEQARIAYEKTVLSSLEEVENALVAYAVGHERLAARTEAARSARVANALARTQYAAGLIDFQKVLDTDRTRLTAEEALASAQAELLTAVVQLYKALGGGWQNLPG